MRSYLKACVQWRSRRSDHGCSQGDVKLLCSPKEHHPPLQATFDLPPPSTNSCLFSWRVRITSSSSCWSGIGGLKVYKDGGPQLIFVTGQANALIKTLYRCIGKLTNNKDLQNPQCTQMESTYYLACSLVTRVANSLGPNSSVD